MEKNKLTEIGKIEIKNDIGSMGFRAALLKHINLNKQSYPMTIKIPYGLLNMIEVAKEEGFKKGIFSTEPKNIDFVKKALDELIDKIMN